MATKAETAVRTYLAWLKGPGALVDHDRVAALRQQLEQTDDQVQRVRLQQQLLDAQTPATDGLVESFVTHAKLTVSPMKAPLAALRDAGVPCDLTARP